MEALYEIPGFIAYDHVAIAVSVGQIEEHVLLYQSLGLRITHREDVLGVDQVREVLLSMGDGSNSVQLLEPLHGGSPVARQLERNGGKSGIAHIAFRVKDIHAAFAYMTSHNFRAIDAAPRKGARGSTVFFVHPKTSNGFSLGYLMEIVEEARDERH